MAQTHLQKTPLGNAIETYHISVLSISLSIELSLFLRNSSQFTLQGLEQPSAGAFNHSALETQWTAAGQGLTFIGYQVDRWPSQRQFSISPQLRYVFYSINTFTLHSCVYFSQDSTNSGNVHTGTTMDECGKDVWQKKKKSLISECFMHLTASAQLLHVLKVLSPVWPVWVVGAVPPWLQDDPLEGSSGAAAHPQIGPSLQDFLKQSKTSCIYLVYT